MSLSACILALVYVVAMLVCSPWKTQFELSPDEGVNLMKADLYSRGYALYGEMWNDQPPLFTVLLSSWFHLAGHDVAAARLLVLMLAGLLLWSFFEVVRLREGLGVAWLASLLLIPSYYFLFLSITVSLGLPSIALAMPGIYFYLQFRRMRKTWLLVSSGVILALAMQVKMSAGVLIPMILVDIWFMAGRKERLREWTVWLLSAATAFLSVACLFYGGDVGMFFQKHYNAVVWNAFPEQAGWQVVPSILLHQEWIVLLAGLAGIIFIMLHLEKDRAILLVWLVSATAVLFFHRPFWPQHYLQFLAPPLSWIAGIGCWRVVIQPTRQWRKASRLPHWGLLVWVFAAGLWAFWVVSVKVRETQKLFAKTAHISGDWEMVGKVAERRAQTRFILTDRPIVAFRAGIPVPPPTAVLSLKRMALPEATTDILGSLETYRPEQVLLQRHIYTQVIDAYLEAHYTRVASPMGRYYLLLPLDGGADKRPK